jgi:hypothetical protein
MGSSTSSREGNSLAGQLGDTPLPPICGDFAMRIDRNGTWYYQGSPIGRPALVKLFSTVLRKDADGVHWLTTPVENGRIEVEDAPFVAVEMMAEGSGSSQIIRFRTNVDDIVTLDEAHPLRVSHDPANAEPRPYVHIRKGLEARILRPVYYHLVERGEADRDDPTNFGIWSSGRFFSLGTLA